MSNNPLCICVTFSLSIHHLKGIQMDFIPSYFKWSDKEHRCVNLGREIKSPLGTLSEEVQLGHFGDNSFSSFLEEIFKNRQIFRVAALVCTPITGPR